MENYSYGASYPESGDSSPRSREIDFDNPPPWEDQNQPPPQNFKVKFMCSYGGKIHPRPHDNQLSYIGGETKILSVDRSIKFSSLIAKLSALCDSESVSFKYQLPGEDLDALISVTNDDDLEHMLHEYDRLYRASPKPARMRLFLFPVNQPLSASSSGAVTQRSFGSEEARSEKERFVEALNSGPVQPPPPQATVLQPQNNMDFLFGLEKGVAPPQIPPLQQVKLRDPIADFPAVVQESDVQVPGVDDRMMASDPIQKHIQDLQRLRLEEQQGLYRRKSEDNSTGGYGGGEYYAQKMPEKVLPVNVPGSGPNPGGYWQEKQVAGGVYHTNTHGAEQQVYMIQTPAGSYHPQMMRPMTAPVGHGQGYYAVQRMPPEVYRDQQQVYNVMQGAPPPVQPVAAAPPSFQPQAPQRMTAAAYSEAISMIRPTSAAGIGMTEAQYSQMAYDSGAGRQVYYNTPGGVMAGPPPPQQQYQTVAVSAAAAAVSADMRPAGALTQDGGKGVPKPTQTSV